MPGASGSAAPATAISPPSATPPRPAPRCSPWSARPGSQSAANRPEQASAPPAVHRRYLPAQHLKAEATARLDADEAARVHTPPVEAARRAASLLEVRPGVGARPQEISSYQYP